MHQHDVGTQLGHWRYCAGSENRPLQLPFDAFTVSPVQFFNQQGHQTTFGQRYLPGEYIFVHREAPLPCLSWFRVFPTDQVRNNTLIIDVYTLKRSFGRAGNDFLSGARVMSFIDRIAMGVHFSSTARIAGVCSLRSTHAAWSSGC